MFLSVNRKTRGNAYCGGNRQAECGGQTSHKESLAQVDLIKRIQLFSDVTFTLLISREKRNDILV